MNPWKIDKLFCDFLATPIEPETLESQSNPPNLYYSLITNTNLSHQTDPWHWPTGSDHFVHKRVNLPPSWRLQQKIKIINFPIIFHLNCKSYRIYRGLEQLSSSICCRVMAQQTWQICKRYLFQEWKDFNGGHEVFLLIYNIGWKLHTATSIHSIEIFTSAFAGKFGTSLKK